MIVFKEWCFKLLSLHSNLEVCSLSELCMWVWTLGKKLLRISETSLPVFFQGIDTHIFVFGSLILKSKSYHVHAN